MKKLVSMLCATVMMLSVMSGGLSVLASENQAVDNSDAVSTLIDPDSWKELEGYSYISKNELGSERYPAIVTYPDSSTSVTESIGINYKSNEKGTGYYQSGVSDFSGIILKEKISLEDFSVTFSINSVGANVGQDAWIGIGMMKKENLWSSVDETVNNGATALFRPSGSREISTYIHEVAPGFNTFNSATVGIPSFECEPIVQGSLLKFSIEKSGEAEPFTYRAKLAQIAYDESGEEQVLSEEYYSNAITKPYEYMDADGKVYLAISASSENTSKVWDLSIKEIAGVRIGSKMDTKPKTPAARAEEILNAIETLCVYDYMEPVIESGKVTDVAYFDEDNAKEFYNADKNDFVDLIIATIANLSEIDEATLNILASQDEIGIEYFGNDKQKYEDFYNIALDKILKTIEIQRAEKLVADLLASYEALPAVEESEFVSEKDLREQLSQTTLLYGKLQTTNYALDMVKAMPAEDSEYENLYEEMQATFDSFNEILEDKALNRYLNFAENVKECGNIESMTMDNIWNFIQYVTPAELTYETFSESFISANFTGATAPQQNKDAKALIDAASAKINSLKTPENIAAIEDLQNTASVILDIFYLPANAKKEHLDIVFETVEAFNLLPEANKEKISQEEVDMLSNSACLSLDDYFKNMTTVTKDNYQLLAEEIEKVNKYVNALMQISADLVDSLSYYEKFENNYKIYNIYTHPIEAKNYVVEEAYLNKKEISIKLDSLFTNENNLTIEYTTNYGEIKDGYFIFTPSEVMVYNVKIVAKNSEYGFEATKELRLNVIENTDDKSGGCSANIYFGEIALIGSVALLVSLVFIIKSKKGNNV